MDEIELYAGKNGIKLVVHEQQWCEMYLIQNNIITRLGADSMHVVISKLLIAFVSMQNRKYFRNSELFGVMALMDPLTTIAGRDNNSELELFCIKDGGNIIPLVTLSGDDIKRWVKQLKDVMKEYNQL